MKIFVLAILVIAAIFNSQAFSEEVYTDNVVIVLDASGSMDNSMSNAQGNQVRKIDAAKTALYDVLKQVPQTTHIGLLVFSSTKGSKWFYELGPRDDAKLKQAINSIQPSSGTPLGTYMKEGADRLLQEREKQHNYGSYRLLIITDGEANSEAKNLVDDYTKDIISRGITVDAIGVKMSAKHTLANKVHSYRSANDPASFTSAIKEVFAEVSSDKTDVASQDAFAEISGIPNEVAVAMISALSNSGNEPIREKLKVQKIESVKSQPVDKGQHQSQQPQKPSRGSGIPWTWIIIGIVLIIIVGGIRKRSSVD